VNKIIIITHHSSHPFIIQILEIMDISAEHPCSAVIGSVSQFLMVVTERTQNLGIDISNNEIDHVCYRCSTVVEYQQVCRDLLAFGSILLESMIGGRPIAMVSLTDPIIYQQWSVRCIEGTVFSTAVYATYLSSKPHQHHHSFQLLYDH
jgi:predicted metalloenzyme YecM